MSVWKSGVIKANFKSQVSLGTFMYEHVNTGCHRVSFPVSHDDAVMVPGKDN